MQRQSIVGLTSEACPTGMLIGGRLTNLLRNLALTSWLSEFRTLQQSPTTPMPAKKHMPDLSIHRRIGRVLTATDAGQPFRSDHRQIVADDVEVAAHRHQHDLARPSCAAPASNPGDAVE